MSDLEDIEDLKVSDIFKIIDSKCSYERICELTQEQRKKYERLLKKFHDLNQEKISSAEEIPNIKQLKGKALEELATYLIKISGGIFIVEQNIRTTTNEIDQVVKLTPTGKYLCANGLINSRLSHFLGECKNYNKKVNVTYIGKFCNLLLTTKIHLGILFSYHGITGAGWKEASGLIRKFYLHKEDESKRFCIIDFNYKDFCSILTDRNFLQIIDEKLEALQLDTNYQNYLSRHPAESDWNNKG